jgi:hypothetical protein
MPAAQPLPAHVTLARIARPDPAGNPFPARGRRFRFCFYLETPMTQQLMHIGSVPLEETPAQVGSLDYEERSRRECIVYKRMLARLFPSPDEAAATLTIKSFCHDFGSYREVCVRYDDTNREATEYAYRLERESPEEWDDIARYERLWLERHEQMARALRKGDITLNDIPPVLRSNDFPALPADETFSELLAAFPL